MCKHSIFRPHVKTIESIINPWRLGPGFILKITREYAELTSVYSGGDETDEDFLPEKLNVRTHVTFVPQWMIHKLLTNRKHLCRKAVCLRNSGTRVHGVILAVSSMCISCEHYMYMQAILLQATTPCPIKRFNLRSSHARP